MATKIYLPRLGESIEEATIGQYLKDVGDPIQRGDVIAELETAKAMMELESPVKGVLLAVFPDVGETINRGTLVAIVGKEDEEWESELTKEASEPEPTEEDPSQISRGQTHQTASPVSKSRVNISPNAKRIARAKGIDVDVLAEKFPNKRITADDVEAFVIEETGLDPVLKASREISLTKTQAITAKKMAESARELPQFSVSIEVNGQALLARNEHYKTLGVSSTITALLIKASAKALRQHPRLNAFYYKEHIHEYEEINIAIAFSTKEGLVAPVIHQTDRLDLKSIAQKLTDLKDKTESHRLSIKDVENATFTLSNLGMMGVRSFTPMVSPQQAAILGVGTMYQALTLNEHHQPIFENRFLLTLSADHRVVGGAECAEFLKTLKTIIELNEGEK